MSIPTYAYYPGPTHTPTPLIPPAPLLGLVRPPAATAPPQPARAAIEPPKGWTRSVHAAPAAYPRTLRDSTGKNSRLSTPFAPTGAAADAAAKAAAGGDKKAKTALQGAQLKNCVDARYDSPTLTVDDVNGDDAPPPLWISAERWVRDDAGGGVTLILTQANGCPKEQWVPVMRDILARDSRTSGTAFGTGVPLSTGTNIVIDEVWFLDDPTHGISVDLNDGILGSAQTWLDTGRDILNFVQHTLPLVPIGPEAPYQLPWGAQDEGYVGRTVIGVGHSFGATAFIHAAATSPKLFSSILCVEPTCPPLWVTPSDYKEAGPGRFMQTAGALRRRTEWPSVTDFAVGRKNPFFGAWAEDAWQLMLTHGVVPLDKNKPDGAVTLATPSWAEAAVFTEPEAVGRGWDALLALRCPTGFVMCGDENPIWTGGKEMTRELVWRPLRARNERIAGGGHLLVQEKPKELAEAIWRFLTTLDAGDWDNDRLQRAKVGAKL